MTQLSVHDALQLALRHQHAGNLKDAEQIYRQILDAYPDQPDALHLLGMIAYQVGGGALPEGENLVRRAIAISPQPAFHLTLGGILLNSKRHDEAIQLYRDLIQQHPALPEAHTHLAIALCAARRFDESIPPFQQSLQLDPKNPYTHGNLGIALTHVHKIEDAIRHLQSATSALPLNPDFLSALATAYNQSNKLDDAISTANRALSLAPNRGQPHHTLSLALTKQNKLTEALPHARRAADLLPDNPDMYSLLADIQRNLHQPDAALETYQRAIARLPENQTAELHANLGTLLLDQSQHDEALTQLRKALSLAQRRPDIHSTLLHALLFHPTLDMQTLLAEHQEFARRHAESLYPTSRNFPNDKNPEKILRIAYITSEARAHPIGLFLLPALQFHDKSQVETFLYSDTKTPDPITTHLQQLADHFQPTAHLTDAQLANQIRTDQIDLLIDLHQHSPDNRALLFARKPAPLQLSIPLHSFTTGLPTIDYRLESIPPTQQKPAVSGGGDGAGQSSLPTAETCIPVPAPLTCYLPRAESIPLTPLPLSQKSPGAIAFACLAPGSNLNPQTLTLFAHLLHALPHSTLTLLAPQVAFRARTTEFLQHNNISPTRLIFVSPQPGLAHFQLFHPIDISLDTFPINTPHLALDSLFMGVPVITLTTDLSTHNANPLGKTVHTLFAHLALADLSATTPTQFIEIAKTLAADAPRLHHLRQNLRTRLRNSPLMSPTKFTQTLEQTCRHLWQRWCSASN
ncbi:MAG: tetratricopeptide repeat protein [Phycisphaerae bacterium]